MPAPFPNTWRADVPADPEGKGRPVTIRHNVGTGQVVPPGMTLGLGQYTAKDPPPNPNIMRVTFAGANVTYDKTNLRD
jgi:hypothetical protein